MPTGSGYLGADSGTHRVSAAKEGGDLSRRVGISASPTNPKASSLHFFKSGLRLGLVGDAEIAPPWAPLRRLDVVDRTRRQGSGWVDAAPTSRGALCYSFSIRGKLGSWLFGLHFSGLVLQAAHSKCVLVFMAARSIRFIMAI